MTSRFPALATSLLGLVLMTAGFGLSSGPLSDVPRALFAAVLLVAGGLLTLLGLMPLLRGLAEEGFAVGVSPERGEAVEETWLSAGGERGAGEAETVTGEARRSVVSTNCTPGRGAPALPTRLERSLRGARLSWRSGTALAPDLRDGVRQGQEAPGAPEVARLSRRSDETRT